MDFSVGEDFHLGQERAMRILERIWQEKTEYETAENGEGAHDREQPEPSRFASNTSHVEDTIGEKLGGGLTKLVAEVEEHDTLRRFGACVPCREGPVVPKLVE